MQRSEHTHLNFKTTAASAILLAAFVFDADAQDADAGLYQSHCAMCHSLDEGTHQMGPSLFRIMGRTAGTVPSFGSSASYIEAGRNGVVWNAETLDVFLTSPRRFLAQHASSPVTNRMPILIQNAEIRARIIEFLIHRQNEGGEP